MPQQLTQVSVFPARDPDLGKIILEHEVQNVLGIQAIRFGFAAAALGSDHSRIPKP